MNRTTASGLRRAVFTTIFAGVALSPCFAQWETATPTPTGGAAREYAAGIAVGSTIVALGGKPFTSANEGDGVVHAFSTLSQSCQQRRSSTAKAR